VNQLARRYEQSEAIIIASDICMPYLSVDYCAKRLFLISLMALYMIKQMNIAQYLSTVDRNNDMFMLDDSE